MGIQDSSQNAGFIFVRHIRACGMCTIKSRRFLLARGWSNPQVPDFFTTGMPIDECEKVFGRDARARQVIERAKQDG